jgi:hypothetical protein
MIFSRFRVNRCQFCCSGPYAPDDRHPAPLNRDEKDILAGAAHVLRFGDSEGETTTPIKAEQLLFPRRHEDRADDLWTVWNVVQENAIKGGCMPLATTISEGRAVSSPAPSAGSIRISS